MQLQQTPPNWTNHALSRVASTARHATSMLRLVATMAPVSLEKANPVALDSSACNFDPNAQCSDGSCEYLDPCGVCGGSGSLSCTNPLAENFDAAATCDDGSCNVFGCTSPLAMPIMSPRQIFEDDSCVFGSCPGATIPPRSASTQRAPTTNCAMRAAHPWRTGVHLSHRIGGRSVLDD